MDRTTPDTSAPTGKAGAAIFNLRNNVNSSNLDALWRTAFALADAKVICDVESEGVQVGPPGQRCWDVASMLDPNEHAPQSIDMSEQALGYGVARGLLRMEPGPGVTVRILRPLS